MIINNNFLFIDDDFTQDHPTTIKWEFEYDYNNKTLYMREFGKEFFLKSSTYKINYIEIYYSKKWKRYTLEVYHLDGHKFQTIDVEDRLKKIYMHNKYYVKRKKILEELGI